MTEWSDVAAEWSRAWGGFAAPCWSAMLAAAGPVSSLLDVGCGAGDLLAFVTARGVAGAGADPAEGMVAHARTRLPSADVRVADASELPWPDRTFDLVTSVNALQFAEDTLAALAEMVRVARPGGHVAVANWAEAARNDLAVIEAALDDDLPPDGDLRLPGGLASLLTDGGLTVVADDVAELPWHAAGDDALVHGILLGEDPETIASLTPAVVDAARPFRRPDGGYLLRNAFRYAVGRTPG